MFESKFSSWCLLVIQWMKMVHFQHFYYWWWSYARWTDGLIWLNVLYIDCYLRTLVLMNISSITGGHEKYLYLGIQILRGKRLLKHKPFPNLKAHYSILKLYYFIYKPWQVCCLIQKINILKIIWKYPYAMYKINKNK